jgi:two-component system chemotaxis sensor kinase CheA
VSSRDDAPGEFLAGFMDDYFAECDEHLTVVRRILIATDAGAAGIAMTGAALEELFRSFHSLKGLSGMVELREAELLAHHMEGYLRRLRAGETVLDAKGLDALIDGTNMLEQVIAARRAEQPPPPIDEAIDRLERLSAATTTPDASHPLPASAPPIAEGAAVRWKAIFTPSKALAERGVTVDRVRTRLRAVGRIVDATPRVSTDGGISFEFLVEGTPPEPDSAEWTSDGVAISREEVVEPVPEIAQRLTSSQFVRVDLARLDELMRMIGDLVISRARLSDSLSRV